MDYVDTQLFINHKLESECEVETFNEEAEKNKMIKQLINLVELNYINIDHSSLTLTKSGYDYFMRKCAIEDQSFNFNSLAPMEVQQAIFETFFKNKSGVNTVEKFVKINLTK